MEYIQDISQFFWNKIADYIGHSLETNLQETLEVKGQKVEREILKYYDISHLETYNVDSHSGKTVKTLQEEQKDVDGIFVKESFIHTISTKKDPKKPNLVLIHGYWSSSLSFVKCVKPLQEYFNVYLIDLPGQALSARIHFEQYTTRQQMLDFFLDNLEEWRKNMFKNEKIYLAGHSFGGFIAGHYACKYEEHLKQLYMISPFGIYDDHGKQSLWNGHVAVSELYQNNFLGLGKFLLKNFLKQTIDTKDPQFDLYYKYYDAIMRMPVSSERCMTTLLKYPSFTAFDPLEHKLKDLKIPIHFFYGSRDWMENETAKNMLDKQQIQGSYSIIPNSGHNIQFDNFTDLSSEILKHK